jgi:hypothetical protein
MAAARRPGHIIFLLHRPLHHLSAASQFLAKNGFRPRSSPRSSISENAWTR